MEIKIAATAEERQGVYALRYACYVDELGWKYDAADPSLKILSDQMDENAIIYYAKDQGKVVATFCLHLGSLTKIPHKWREHYALERFQAFPDEAFCFISRYVVAPEYRGSLVSLKILMKGYSDAWRHGVRLSFCFCRPRLIDLYERLGFMRYKSNIYEPTQGYMVPMVMMNEDAEHLRRVRSPLLKICEANKPDSTVARWFDAHFPEARATTAKQTLSAEEFVRQWAEALNARPVTLLQGFTEEQVQKLLMAGTILHCHAGDRLLNEGEAGHEMFLIIEGRARIIINQGSAEFVIALLAEGEAFGEGALVTRGRRSATVEAASELKVLVISQEFLRSAMRALPDLAMRLLFNLSVLLSDKLHDTSRRLMSTLMETDKRPEKAA